MNGSGSSSSVEFNSGSFCSWLWFVFAAMLSLPSFQVATLLHDFDASTRFKLAQLNEKLSKIERQVEYVEASLKHVMAPENQDRSGGGQR
jgi:hypothetical protein